MEQRKQLLQTAWELFVKYGVRRVSVLDICNEVHISKKTFYLHFASKEDLVDGLMNGKDNSGKIVNGINASSGNIIDYIVGSIAKAQKMIENKQMLNVLFDIEKYYPNVCARHQEKKEREMRLLLETAYKKGLEQDLFRADANLEFINSSVTLLNHEFFALGHSKTYTPRDIMDLLLRMLFNAKGLAYYEQLLAAQKQENK